jgi:hypothetical protein
MLSFAYCAFYGCQSGVFVAALGALSAQRYVRLALVLEMICTHLRRSRHSSAPLLSFPQRQESKKKKVGPILPA